MPEDPIEGASPVSGAPAERRSASPPAQPADRPSTPAEPSPGRPPVPPLRTGAENRVRPARGPRPELVQSREPIYREIGGYRFRMNPADLARLRELPGSKGKTDQELGEEFLTGHGERLRAAIAGDVPADSEIRVVVDPYSRQAFLAVESRIRGITSF